MRAISKSCMNGVTVVCAGMHVRTMAFKELNDVDVLKQDRSVQVRTLLHASISGWLGFVTEIGTRALSPFGNMPLSKHV